MTNRRPAMAIVLALVLVGGARAAWFDYHPAGCVNGRGILHDVLSRCDAQGKRTAYDASHVTHCHEGTHMLNSRIRRELRRSNWNAIYVGGGKAFAAPEPRVTLDTVARYVPQQLRNSAYQLYFVQQRRDWNNQPLYILDEWSAYANGSQAAKETGADPHGTYERAQWFCGYADALLEAVRRHDPGYSQLKELTDFIAWQKKRVASFLAAPPNATARTEVKAAPLTQFCDLAPQLRTRNRAGSCVHASTVNMLRWLGQYRRADDYWSRHSGGEVPRSHKRQLDAEGLKYAMTSDGDMQLIHWAIANRRMVGVTWSPNHFINLCGVDAAGNAILLGNNNLDRYELQPWPEFEAEFKRQGGWAVVLLEGIAPPPTPNA